MYNNAEFAFSKSKRLWVILLFVLQHENDVMSLAASQLPMTFNQAQRLAVSF